MPRRTGRKRGPKGPRVDYEPALRAMVPLVVGGLSDSAAARQVVARGLVHVISGKEASARRLRRLYAENRTRLLLEYQHQREQVAALSARVRDFMQTVRTVWSIAQSPEVVGALEAIELRLAEIKKHVPSPDVVRAEFKKCVPSSDVVRALETLAQIQTRIDSLAQSPDVVRLIKAFARSLEELRSRALAAFPVEILAEAFRNFSQPPPGPGENKDKGKQNKDE